MKRVVAYAVILLGGLGPVGARANAVGNANQKPPAAAVSTLAMPLGSAAARETGSDPHQADVSTCSASGPAGDIGSPGLSADRKCWHATAGASGGDARQWGVKADGFTANDGAITANSTIFSAASRACAPTDAGKILVVSGAGIASAPLHTAVSGCNGSTYILARAAETTQTGAQWGMGTDNAVVLAKAISAAYSARLCLPAGQILIDSATVALDHITLCGQAVPQNRVAASGHSADQGTTILLTSRTAQPFTVGQSVRVEGVSFFWPGQSDVSGAPTAYPPLFTDTGSTQLSDFTFERSNVINAFDFFTQNSAGVVMGGVRVVHSNIYAIRRAFSLTNVGETIFVDGDLFNASVWYAGAVARARLGTWTATNGAFLYVFGDGTGSTCGSAVMGGFVVTGGTTIVGERWVVDVEGGNLDESHFDSSVDANGVGQVMFVGANGSIHRTSFRGRYYPNGVFGVRTAAAAFVYDQSCTGGAVGGASDFVIDASVVGAQSSAVQVTGTTAVNADLHGLEAYNYGVDAGRGSPAYLLYADNPNASIELVGSHTFPAHAGPDFRGVSVSAIKLLNVVGATCVQTFYCVDVSAISGGTANLVGITATGTTSPVSLRGTYGVSIHAMGNLVDAPNPKLDAVTAVATLVDPGAAYNLPTSNGQTYRMNGQTNSVQIDSAARTVTTAVVVLPAGALNNAVISISADSNLILTLNPASGDQSACGSGALSAGQSLRCIFHQGIGVSAPHGKWFTY